MKKFIIIAASLLLAANAHAQLGVVAGITSSKTSLQEAKADVNNATQYHVGLTYKMDLGLLAIQPSILYNMKGAKFEGVASALSGGSLTADDFEYKTGYVEIPVQIQAGLDLSLARVYGFVEPFVGYAVANQVKYDISNPQATWDNIKNKMEYGIGLGAGVELIKHVQVSVRYFWNLGQNYGQGENASSVIAATAATLKENKCNGIAASVAILF